MWASLLSANDLISGISRSESGTPKAFIYFWHVLRMCVKFWRRYLRTFATFFLGEHERGREKTVLSQKHLISQERRRQSGERTGTKEK